MKKKRVLINFFLIIFCSFYFHLIFSMDNNTKSLEEDLLNAIMSNNYQKLSQLISKKINLNFIDDDGDTPLMWAATLGQYKITKLLIENGCQINYMNSEKDSALYCAIQANKINIVELLLKHNVDLNLKYHSDNNALLIAANHNRKKIIELLLNTKKIDVNETNIIGETALNIAVIKNSKKIIKILIDAGADLEIRDNIDGNTPLINAAKQGNKKIIKQLLYSGAKINAKNYKNKTALTIISKKNNYEMTHFLKNTIQELKEKIILAIKIGDYNNFVKYIKQYGTLMIKDEEDNNLLHIAIKYSGNKKINNLEIIKLIIYLKPEFLTCCNNLGETPISFIFANQDIVKLIKSLIQNS